MTKLPTLSIEQFAKRLKAASNLSTTAKERDKQRRKENADIRRRFREELRLSRAGIMPDPIITATEFTPQIYDPAIHTPLIPQYVPPSPPVHKNQAQKRLEKRQAKALAKEAKAEAKANKPTQEEIFYSKFKRPAPREV